MPRLLVPVAAAVAATIALSGCIVLPSAPPPPPVGTPVPSPTTPATQQPSTAPTSPSTTGGPGAEVDGTSATITADGVVWSLELLEFGPAPLDELQEYAGEEGAPAPEPPAGLEVGWACFRATLVEAPDEYASLLDVMRDISVPGSEDGFDYETIDSDLDVYGSTSEVGETLDRVCPILLVPEGFGYDAVTLDLRDEAGQELSVDVTAP